MTLQRYSEKRLEDRFDVNLLFSEPLQFAMSDVVDAIVDEFPGLGSWFNLFGGKVFDTGEVITAFLTSEDAPSDGMVSFVSLPGPLPKDGHYDSAINRAFAFKGAWDAWNAHTSHLTVTVSSEGKDLASRFRAARLATCVSATIASDPTCVGVMFPSGDVFASPEAWRKGAHQAMANEWPLDTWFSYEINQFAPDAPGEPPHTSCGAVGMAAFNGQEVSFAAAAVNPVYAGSYVQGAIYLLLAGGNGFKDGDTMGVENGDERIRVRFLEEGPNSQTDSWVLIHPSSKLDEMAMFGERANPPPPPGVDNSRRPKDNFMEDLVGEAPAQQAMPEGGDAPAGPFGKRKAAAPAPETGIATLREDLRSRLLEGHITFEAAQTRHQALVSKINAQIREMGGGDLKWTPICPSACVPGELASYLLDEICLDPFLKWNILYFAADPMTALLFDTVQYDAKWEGHFDNLIADRIRQSRSLWLEAIADHHKTGDDVKLRAVRDYIRVTLNDDTLVAYRLVIGDKQDHIQQFFKIAV